MFSNDIHRCQMLTLLLGMVHKHVAITQQVVLVDG